MSALFTKVGYAQMRSQQFAVPPSWAAVSLSKVDAKANQRAELGMKVTCGFEMLMSDPHNQDQKAVREIAMILEDSELGQVELPTNERILSWEWREDDEGWLDINFEDFEKELQSRDGRVPEGVFGDRGAQENLRKMVSRLGK